MMARCSTARMVMQARKHFVSQARQTLARGKPCLNHRVWISQVWTSALPAFYNSNCMCWHLPPVVAANPVKRTAPNPVLVILLLSSQGAPALACNRSWASVLGRCTSLVVPPGLSQATVWLGSVRHRLCLNSTGNCDGPRVHSAGTWQPMLLSCGHAHPSHGLHYIRL